MGRVLSLFPLISLQNQIEIFDGVYKLRINIIKSQQVHIKYIKTILLISCLLLLFNCKKETSREVKTDLELMPVTYSFTELQGLGMEKGITRRDPSDIILVNGTYYVYYTKVMGKASGYWGDIWYATSTNGLLWKEKDQILGVGKVGDFDAQAVFTPNIMMAEGNYYLFYTGVKPTPGRTDGLFENNSTTDITAIGLATADNPNGPFIRERDNPVLEVSESPEKFDSYRVDDAALLFRDGNYRLYYKGRSKNDGIEGPVHTQMGVAISKTPEGPYIKYISPLLDKSHEVLIWKHGEGIAALASISSTLEYSKTGLNFTSDKKRIKVVNRPFAPGAYRPDLTGNKSDKLKWGISMVHNGPSCYLVRYDVREE